MSAQANSVASDLEQKARRAAERSQQYLLSVQNEKGWWKGALDTNVTMDAEDLLMREFLGIRTEEQTRQSALWIRSQQRSDGSWASFFGGPPVLSATIEAYVALRLAGDAADAEHMKRASQLIRDMGGLEKTRVFTRIWMALFGLWSWDDLPAMPPEMIFLPSWFPLNIYDFACWARQTVVALTVVTSERPVREIGFTIDELRTYPAPAPLPPLSSWAGRFERLNKILHAYQRRPIRWLRRHAYRKAKEWIVQRQEADGCWGGIQPPWVYSTMALHLLGLPLDHPVLAKAVEGLEGFTIIENGVRRIEACQSPVWDTALAMVALGDSGLAPDHPAMIRAADWLLDEEVRVRGDWAVRRPDLEPSGWAFEFENDNYPDIDDTAEVVLALRKVAHPDPARVDAAVDRGIAWMFGMTSKTGSWASFDADNVQALIRELPFCDFGEVIDPPSSDVTAHVLEALAHEGYRDDPRCERARQWLLAEQEPGGSWFGRWGANHTYGTGAAVPALAAMGDSPDAPATRRAVKWLEKIQNPDGGWGEDMRSYVDPEFIGCGDSTASQTGWVLLALLAAKERSPAVERGITWLTDRQREDGGWDEDQFTGTGFPGDFYINYHIYRHVFPLTALGRFLSGKS
jgi:squalene-hopene/tetraprenyl-beta-curcumene cyclase